MLRHFILVSAFVLSGFGAYAQPVSAPPSFADLSARVSDAVVNISTSQKLEKNDAEGRAPQIQMPEFPPGSPFQDLFEDFFNAPGAPGNPFGGPPGKIQSLGSGFIIDVAKGYIVTNNHVIDKADEIKITLHDDTKLDAKVVGRDPETDLALLQVKPTKSMVAVTWGNSDAMRVGDWVLAVGNPFGLGGTVTSGIISARQRDIQAGRYDDFIQTDASINTGNSGGPMFNLDGQVIGINTAILSPTGGSVGIGFAIPSNLAKNVIDQLITFGSTKRGWIGVSIQEVTDDIAESLGISGTAGALIANVTPDGPAAKAGIKQGDIILSYNNKAVAEMRFLPRIVAESPIGVPTPVIVLRQGKELRLNITPGQLEKAREEGLLDSPVEKADAEKPAQGEIKIPALKLAVAPINDGLRTRFNLEKDMTGLVVTTIDRDSDAAQKGIGQGDIILEINQKPITNAADIRDIVKAAVTAKKPSVLLLVNSQSNLRFVAVKLAD